MSAAGWPAYRELLLQVVREDSGYRMMKRVTWLVTVAAVLIVATFHHWGKPTAGKGMLTISLWGLALMWASAFMKSAIAQARPEYANLVPQLRTRLMRLTGALFVSSSLLLGLLAGLLFGYPGYALLAGGVMSVYIMLTPRYPWVAFSPSVIALALVQSGYVEEIGYAVHHGLGQLATTVFGGLLLLALGTWGLRVLFPRGGDAHWAWFKRQSRAREAARSPTQLVPVTRFGIWWQGRRGTRYLAALRDDSRTGATPQRMMMHALGPAVHPSGYILSVLANTIAALALLLVVEGRIQPGSYALMGNALQWAVLACSMMFVLSAIDSATRYRTEQAIFFLSAGAPAMAQVNRLLGGALLRRFFVVWLATLAGAAVIDSLIQQQAGLRGATVMLAVLMLPLACKLLRNYAVAQPAGKGTSWVVWMALYMIVCNLLMAVAKAGRHLPWFWLAGVFAAGSLLVLYRYWRKLVALPAVLPSGRLAA